MICFAAIVPHSPLLMTNISRDLVENKKTIDALDSLASILARTKPEILIIISSHGPVLEDAFSLNLSPQYSGNFKEFGDLTTRLELSGNMELNYKIKEFFETDSPNIPLIMITEPNLDYSFSVPLYHLMKGYKEFSIIPIGSCGLDYGKHFVFGEKLKEELVLNNKRIGIVVSANFSHCTEEGSEENVSSSKNFDKKLIKLLQKRQTNQFLNLDRKLMEKFEEKSWPAMLILLGILNDLNYGMEVLSYEILHGSGQAVINFDFDHTGHINKNI